MNSEDGQPGRLPLPGSLPGSARGRMRNWKGSGSLSAISLDKSVRRLRTTNRRRRIFSPLGGLGALGVLMLLVLALRFSREKRRRKRIMGGATGEPASLLVAVASRPREGHMRDVIRRTWATNLDHRSTIRFFVGEPNHSDGPEVRKALNREIEEETDIVPLDFFDTYENLTLKTLSIFQWAKYNSHEDYILKMDTDAYVKLPELQDFLRSQPREKVYTGSVLEFGKYIPYRKGNNKWVISHEDYPNFRWPPYCFGSGYVVSTELAAAIAECMPKDPSCTSNKSYTSCDISDRCPFRPVRFEDVTVGGILLYELTGERNIDLNCSKAECASEVRALYEPFFNNHDGFVNEPWHRDGKHECKDDFLLFHRVNAEMMQKYYDGREGKKVTMCSLAPHIPEHRVKVKTEHAPVQHEQLANKEGS